MMVDEVLARMERAQTDGTMVQAAKEAAPTLAALSHELRSLFAAWSKIDPAEYTEAVSQYALAFWTLAMLGEPKVAA